MLNGVLKTGHDRFITFSMWWTVHFKKLNLQFHQIWEIVLLFKNLICWKIQFSSWFCCYLVFFSVLFFVLFSALSFVVSFHLSKLIYTFFFITLVFGNNNFLFYIRNKKILDELVMAVAEVFCFVLLFSFFKRQ